MSAEPTTPYRGEELFEAALKGVRWSWANNDPWLWEDCVQEFCLGAIEALAKMPEDESRTMDQVRGYQYRSAQRAVFSFLRWLRRRLRTEQTILDAPSGEDNETPIIDVWFGFEVQLDKVEAKIDGKELWEMVDRLEEKLREVIDLRFRKNLSRRQVCEHLQLGNGSVQFREERALRELQKLCRKRKQRRQNKAAGWNKIVRYVDPTGTLSQDECEALIIDLPDDLREVVCSRVSDDLSYYRIAKNLGVGLQTVQEKEKKAIAILHDQSCKVLVVKAAARIDASMQEINARVRHPEAFAAWQRIKLNLKGDAPAFTEEELLAGIPLLHPDLRVVMQLRHEGGMTWKQIAGELGIADGTAYDRQRQANVLLPQFALRSRIEKDVGVIERMQPVMKLPDWKCVRDYLLRSA
jgi:RNA polymerase sigma factor (sigma-70 family)